MNARIAEPDVGANPSACTHCGLPVRPGRPLFFGRRAARIREAGRAHAEAVVPLQEQAPAEQFCCVGCRLAHNVSGGEGRRGLLEARLLVASFLCMGIMTLSLVLYAEDLVAAGGEAGLLELGGLGRAALAALSLPVLALLGTPMLQGAWADARQGRMRLDGLIVLATGAAYSLSAANAWRGSGPVYFETAAMVLLLVTFGRRLEAHARERGRDAADALKDVLPRCAHRLRGERVDSSGPDGMTVARRGVHEDVDPQELQIGDVCHVLPGEAIPADVVVLKGRGEIVTAMLTGEQAPRAVGPGDGLPAGATNGPVLLEVRVQQRATEGTLGRLRALLDAPLDTAAAVRAADRLAGVLVWVVSGLAAAAGLWAGWEADTSAGVRRALSVLLVACPCALGLATPLAYRASRAALARRGLLARKAAALESAAGVDVVVLDKTGTLTEPEGSWAPLLPVTPHMLWRASELVAHSGHALAASFREHRQSGGDAGGLRAAKPSTAGMTDVELLPGCGVQGRVQLNSDESQHFIQVGSPRWLDALGARWSEQLRAARRAAEKTGSTLVAVAEQGVVQAVGAVQTRLREGAAEAVRELKQLGVEVLILSGDRAATVDVLACQLDVRGEGDLVPAQKTARVEALRAAGRRVLMAGDGMNDAPALRAADLGVALGSGTALAREQADVELLGDDLRALPVLIQATRALRRTVRGNLSWTMAYNVVALGAAATGQLHPLLAVLAMVMSSLVVSARSRRLLETEPVLFGGSAPLSVPLSVPASGRGAARGPGGPAAAPVSEPSLGWEARS